MVRSTPTWDEARGLLARLQEGAGLREYVAARLVFVVPAGVLFLLVSVACAAATVIFLVELHWLLALPGLVLAPFVLVGSLFVQAYVFFSWLEGRALAHDLGHTSRSPFGLGEPPPVPWVLATVFLFIPLAVLASISTHAALVLIVLVVLTPVLIARFDR